MPDEKRKEPVSGTKGGPKGKTPGGVSFVPDACSTPRENLHLGKGIGIKSWGFCV